MLRQLTLLMVFFLSACAAPGPFKVYSGPEKALADIVLIDVPEPIEVMSVDGRDISGNLLRKNMQLALLPGDHVFGLRYVELFQIDSENHDVIRSKQAALRFRAVAGSRYQLQMPPQKTVEQAKQFAAAPEFSLIDAQQKNPVATSVAIQSYAEASLIDTITKTFNSANQEDAQRLPDNVDLLKSIWSRSSDAEKVRFQQWLDGSDVQKPK